MTTIVKNGKIGENVNFKLDSDGLLTISGSGPMYSNASFTAFYDNYIVNDIKTIVIEKGVTCIGDYAFYNCKNLANITIHSSVTTIGKNAFVGCTSLTDVYYLGSEAGWNKMIIDTGNTCLNSALVWYMLNLGKPTTTASRVLSGINVSWTTVPGARGYQVYRKADTESTYSRVAVSISNSWTDTNVESNMAYRYMVRAYAVDVDGTVYYGNFSPSSQAGFITQVKGVKISSSSAGIRLSWNAISGVRGYQVYRKASFESSYTMIQTCLTTTYTDNANLVNGIEYSYMIRAYNTASDKSVYTGAFSTVAYTTAMTALPKVTNLTATRALKGIVLTWTPIDGVSGYEIYRMSEKESSYSKVGDCKNGSWTDTDVLDNTYYRYMVRAYVDLGNGATTKGAFCSSKGAGFISQVKNLKSIKNYVGIELSWSPIYDVRGYQIYRRSDNESTYSLVATTVSLGWVDKNVKTNLSYSYMVRGYNKAPDGMVYYGTFSADVSDGYIPKVENLFVTSVSNGISLSWTLNGSALGYQIYRRGSGESNYTKVGESYEQKWVDKETEIGKSYHYMVRGYGMDSDLNVFVGTFSTVFSHTRNEVTDSKIYWNIFIDEKLYRGYMQYQAAYADDYHYACFDIDGDKKEDLLINMPYYKDGYYYATYVFRNTGNDFAFVGFVFDLEYNSTHNVFSNHKVAKTEESYEAFRFYDEKFAHMCTYTHKQDLANETEEYIFIDASGTTHTASYDAFGFEENKDWYLGNYLFNWKNLEY